jgi:hypothetical protein
MEMTVKTDIFLQFMSENLRYGFVKSIFNDAQKTNLIFTACNAE